MAYPWPMCATVPYVSLQSFIEFGLIGSQITPPEHNNIPLLPSAGFIQQQPPMNRRHTAMPTRPLRSSPLAGPALSSEGVLSDEVENATDNSRPELASVDLPPPSPSIRSPTRSHSSLGLSLSPPPSPTSPAPPTRRRASFVNLSRKHRSSSKNEDPSSPSSSSSHFLTTPHWVHQGSKSNSDSSHVSVSPRPRSLSQNSPPLLTKPGTPSRDNNDSPPAGVENWLTTNTYETTPRFSRLGLGASSVVLPVSAREYKHKERRLSRTSSKTSLSSFDSLNTNMRTGSSSRAPSFIGTGIGSFLGSGDIGSRGTSQSLPSLSLTRTTSGASGSGCSSRARSSMELRPPSPGMSGLPAPSLSDLCSLDEEEGDLGEFGPLPLPMISSREKENTNVKAPRVEERREKKRERQESQPGNPGWRLRSISIKSLRSIKSTHKKTPASEIRRPAGAEVTRLEVTLTRSHETDDVRVKGMALDEKNLNHGQKQGNGLRKLWRTLTLSKGGRRGTT